VVRIVNACGKAGVKSLKYGELELSFDEKVTTVSSWTEPFYTEPKNFVASPIDLPDNEDDGVIEPIDEAEIEELKITNPAAYEEIMEKAYA
jgi:hypothetical protein